jgi:hypothetical protein
MGDAMTDRWELVTERRDSSGLSVVDRTERLEVPGGWLYRTVINIQVRNFVSVVFVPDPTYIHTVGCL